MADKIYKPKPISGFPEFLPEIRLIEQEWQDIIRNVFESYGFCNIETPIVEELDVLLAKGETDKEIYILQRLQADENDKKEARLGLHFDQTVPMARYVAMNFNELTFPFKRYQMQKVWRGERPQEGRYREFVQCDIDVINVDNLPLHFDAEMPAIIHEIFVKLDIGAFTVKLNNRKILSGFLTALGIDDHTAVTRIMDKRDKIGIEALKSQLIEFGLDTQQSDKIIALTNIQTSDASFVEKVQAIGLKNEILEQGLSELAFVMNSLPFDNKVADLSVARGLDYYTGTVYETVFDDDPLYGSICSGGRYDDLAGTFINKNLPGVGISIGFTRLFARMIKSGRFAGATRNSPADILAILPEESQRPQIAKICALLRKNGLKVEMYHSDSKIKKQFQYAEKKGIPYILLPSRDNPDAFEIKNMATGTQTPVNCAQLSRESLKNLS